AAGKKEQRNLSVIFEKDRLARVIGDLMSTDAETPQATGFNPLLKPAPVKPAAEAKPAAKPPAEAAAEAAKPPAEAPAPAQAAESWEPTKQNGGNTPAEPEKKAEPAAPEVKSAEAAPAEKKPEEKGFFGRMMEKIGL